MYKNSKYEYVLDPGGYCLHDEFNNARIAKDKSGEASWWWLRAPGSSVSCAAYVRTDGSVSIGGIKVGGARDYGASVYHSDIGVRPAMWLNLYV